MKKLFFVLLIVVLCLPVRAHQPYKRALSKIKCSLKDDGDKTQFRGTVLWLGTSIPAGCTYPANCCKNLGLKCINKSIGASFMHFSPQVEDSIMGHHGYAMTATKEDEERKYQPAVKAGRITEEQLQGWKKTSYEEILIPYLQEADYIVIDHGYNDGSEEWMYDLIKAGKKQMDWTSTDRTNFFGAFNYIYRVIKRLKPDAKIIVGGYFQNSCTTSYLIRGKYTAIACQWIAEHYNLPLLNVWDYVHIPDGYAPHTSQYLDDLNKQYDKHFTKAWQDKKGNITYFQLFCPDAVHPFSDPTGVSDRMLDKVFTILLRKAIKQLQ